MWINSCFVLVVFMLSGSILAHAEEQRHQYPLDSGWSFKQTASAEPLRIPQWHPASIPGSVHLDLLRNGLISDPFFRDNSSHLQWIENADWEYRDLIEVNAAMLGHPHVDLVFDGLDTNAQVYVNDTLLLNADNMFRQWRVQIKPYLRQGQNTIRVFFPSPLRAAAEAAAKDGWRNRTHAPTPDKTYLRKAAYEYGWDWGPRFVTSGIWRAVHLETWDQARISDLYVRQLDIHSDVAHLSAEVEITAATPGDIRMRVRYRGRERQTSYVQAVALHAGVNRISLPVEIDNPTLWYPAGYGAQPLYTFTASLECRGHVEDTASTYVGLRSVVLRRDPDQWGRSFELVVNGIPIFAKGASVIPLDSFPSRVSTADYQRLLESARNANMNMVRQWGGGYYETDEFYNLCDQLGLMVWQDFMFGNEWQPGTPNFQRNVGQEIEGQLRRLRHHPSIVIWCGNNETEASWKWGRTVEMTLGDAEVGRHMWQNYLTLFSGVIARTVERLDPETPFWPSSPSADYEDTSADFRMPDVTMISSPQTYMSGDMHNYGVQTAGDYEKYFPRFASEYGNLSLPSLETVQAYTSPEDRANITTPAMLAHQDGSSGNATILRDVERHYGKPKDLASTIYLSQLYQAEWVKTGAEHLRRNMPRTMGSLFWQLNDCWPAASLSSIDYFGRWKALQYYARRFYSPLLVSPHVESGSLRVYVVSDKTESTDAEVILRIMKPDGTVVMQKIQTVTIPALSSFTYLDVPIEQVELVSNTGLASVFACAEILVHGKSVSRNLVYFVPERELHSSPTDLNAELTRTGAFYTLRLAATSLTRNVFLSFGNDSVTLSDNYFDLLPGETRYITINSNTDIIRLRKTLAIRSMVDAIALPSPSTALGH